MPSARPEPPRLPSSTYRVQFNQQFTFRDAERLVPYLDRLGISDLYASPYLQARTGSMHGYDISRHDRLNPEIGTPAEHAAMAAALRDHGMGHLLDIVPNHMGIGSANDWWMDVLENGPSSPYAPYFDIDWNPLKPELAGKVLLPVLGDQFGKVLENGELQLHYEQGRFRVEYHEHRFPVSPKSSSLVLRGALDEMAGGEEEDRTELESIVTALEHLPSRDRTDPASVAERRRENAVSRRRVAALHQRSEAFRRALARTVEVFNGTPGEPHSYDRMERLLDDQAYRLSFWRVAAEEINYRRFFDINELAGLRVERPEVFQDTHRLILQMVERRDVTGLRIDHPDGLYDPPGYLAQLQHECERRAGEPVYVLVEKILTGDEELPEDWAVSGTVGYEFMNRLNALFVDPAAEPAMDAVYRDFVHERPRFAELVYDRKKLILRIALVSELNVLAFLLNRISEQHRRVRDFTLGALTDALREVIACFPVYRTYIDAHSGRLSDTDRAHVERAIRTAVRRNPATSRSLFEFLRETLLLEWPDTLDEEARQDHATFVMKFQQLTGPVMAKGVEDTTFYLYNRLISLNEVGGEPTRFGSTPAEFHRWMAARRQSWPHSLNGTSTHDTKRSEDVRARIDVLSEMPEEWAARVRQWAELNERHHASLEGDPVPDRNDEYLLYQTLVGAWPLEPLDEAGHAELVERIQQYMEKATREAKAHTSWINPNEEYDRGLQEFVARALAWDAGLAHGAPDNPFLADFLPFQAEVARLGMHNALAQTALKLMAPGVPDVYQGQELWDFSLVDPDNRRPVDYELRRRLLEGLDAQLEEGDRAALCEELARRWRDGRCKLYLTTTLLRLRRELRAVFDQGDYLPLEAEGAHAERVAAFARVAQAGAVLVVAPRLTRAVGESGGWGETLLRVAGPLTGRWRDVLSGAETELSDAGVPLAELLARFPVAVLRRL